MSGNGQSPQYKKLMVWAKEYGFTQDERIELSQYLLRRDIGSWTELDEGQVKRLLDAFEGHHLIDQILLMRP